ncbi:tripartite tricarboxylate transporter substrate binding protein [Roseomonas chloroacetimidivorans]|uniref:tripartite tricarboxylate transporter substrate binding protein n=1 Tax=Roseomonas chloroacetimidivorans TaxID=1766656 RepID=UPI003C72C27E
MVRIVLPRRALLGGALAAPAVARAQAYPARPVTLIAPAPPGGGLDTSLRLLAQGMSQHLPQPVVVENRPGASQTLGAAAVARARPDGYLLTAFLTASLRVQILNRLAFDPLKDFTPVAHVSGFTVGCVARRDRFPNGWADFVAEARRRPGELNYGSTGVNGTPHVGMAELAVRERLEVNHVPFRGDADALQAVLGGHIDCTAGSSSLGGAVDGGTVKWLHIWSARQAPRWPDAPTLLELGYDGMVLTSPFGILGPAGMAPEVVRLLQDRIEARLKDADFLEGIARFDMIAEFKTSDAYRQDLVDSTAREHELIRRLNLQPV